MSEETPVTMLNSLWLRIRITHVPQPTEAVVSEVSPTGQRYRQTYNSFSGEAVCEVMQGHDVVGFIPNFQGVKIGTGVGDACQTAQLDFLCFDNPYIEGGIKIR